MSNRNFDSRVIIQHLQYKNRSTDLFNNTLVGSSIIKNPQTSDYRGNIIDTFHNGSQKMYLTGLIGNRLCSTNCCTLLFPSTPTSTTPSAPFITSVISGDSQLTVFFTPPIDDGGSSITNYQYSIDGGISFINLNSLTSPFIITGLLNGTTYPIVIRAINSIGAGLLSNIVNGTPATTPSAPFITSVVSGDSQLTVFFTPPIDDGGSTIINYQYSIDGGISFINLNSLTSPFIITGLLNGTTYPIVIRAINNVGTGLLSNIVNGTPATTPSAPFITSVVSGDSQLTVFFTPPIDDGGSSITNYQYSIDGGISFINLNSLTSPFIITGLLNGTTYPIVIRAINNVGAGLLSNIVNGTPLPIISFQSWVASIGGTGLDRGEGIATDLNGDVYTCGRYTNSTFINSFSTVSSGIILTSTFGELKGAVNFNSYIAKYDPMGNVLWGTNISGASNDQALAIATDLNGNIYVTGSYGNSTFINSVSTVSSGIIQISTFGRLTLDPIIPLGTLTATFISKYDSFGNALWATNLVGNQTTSGFGVTTDLNGNVYVIGSYDNSTFINSFSTVSSGIILTSSIGRLIGSGTDAYITKYDSVGNALWATNVGGGVSDSGRGIVTDLNGNIYFIGQFGSAGSSSTIINSFSTISSGIIVTSSIGTLFGGGNIDGFIVKYDSFGNALWATNFGGTGSDIGRSIATDLNGNIYACGRLGASTFINSFSTISSGIIVTSSIGELISVGNFDAYIAKYDSFGNALWATNFGGTGVDDAEGIATDLNGNVYVTGLFTNSTFINSFSTISSGIIVTSSIGRLIGEGGLDGYIAKYDSFGNGLWASHFGSPSTDGGGLAVATDLGGNVYVTGGFGTIGGFNSTIINSFSTISSGIIVTSTIGRLIGRGGNGDALIIKLRDSGQFL
jgi:hypothetical protein